jgi:chromosome segregation ATPase
MKTGILLGVVVVLVLLSQAGIGYLAFKTATKEEVLAEMQQQEQGRIEKLRAVISEIEVELNRLQPEKASLEGNLASLKKQVEQVEIELEQKSGKVRQLQVEEKRLVEINDKSQNAARELATLEAASAAAQEGFDAKQKQAALLEARIQRQMDDYTKMTKDSAFVETAESVGKLMSERLLKLQATLSEQEEAARASAAKAAESRVIFERASGDLKTLEEQKSALEEEIFARRRELASLDGEISSKKRKPEEASGTSDKDPNVAE